MKVKRKSGEGQGEEFSGFLDVFVFAFLKSNIIYIILTVGSADIFAL